MPEKASAMKMALLKSAIFFDPDQPSLSRDG